MPVENSVTAPDGVIRAIEPCVEAAQTLPSGPVVIPRRKGVPETGCEMGNSVTWPGGSALAGEAKTPQKRQATNATTETRDAKALKIATPLKDEALRSKAVAVV
jgi:hypothetical protein